MGNTKDQVYDFVVNSEDIQLFNDLKVLQALMSVGYGCPKFIKLSKEQCISYVFQKGIFFYFLFVFYIFF